MEFFEHFVDVLLFTLWILVMVTFFTVVVRIIIDIFRDDKLRGLGKTFWFLLILVLPVLGSLIYLIVRGGGMANRDVAQAARVRQAQRDHAQGLMEDVAAGPAGQIKAAKELLDAGVIDAAEFDALKVKALS